MSVNVFVEMQRRYGRDHSTVPVEYELGRADGYVDGFDDAHWKPTRYATVRESLPEQIEYAFAHAGRPTRAYTLGYARGYREAGPCG